ncbi:MAG: amino acid adenylation domain-containing protein [Janthinobacterium lividum]
MTVNHNATNPGDKQFRLVQQLFQDQILHTLDAVAVSFADQRLTYQELDHASNFLATQITQQAFSSDLIAISTTRSIEMIVGILAILKAGKAYLPLDPSYPKDRLKQLIAGSGIQFCLSAKHEQAFFEKLGLGLIASTEKPDSVTAIKQGELAYVLYTSGSTGAPKGVCMGHAALANLITWQKQHSVAGANTKTLQFAPLSFDVSFQEIFATLCSGGELVLIEDNQRLDPNLLLKLIQDEQINRLFLPFVALQYLTEAAVSGGIFPTSLQEIITAGEQLKITPQVRTFFSALPGCALFNQYGPTECHVVTQLKLEGDAQNWPDLPSIGTTIDAVEVLILNENLQPVAAGETGELCLSGVCLAQGYLHQPELTAEKFPDIFYPVKEALRIYRTGDLAAILPDGNINFWGRIDHQIKIRGNRIEPGEIETLLNQSPAVKQSVVVAREDVPGLKRLVAYLVASGDQQNSVALREIITQKLPDYMMPAAFIWLKQLPFTSSGKVDKKQLPAPDFKRPELTSLYKSPSTEIEIKIAASWSALLQIAEIGTDDSFFELGGNSLLALKFIAGLKTLGEYHLPITKLYQFPTIGGIANYILNGQTSTLTQKNTGKRSIVKEIAVIGMACRFPGANNPQEFWDLLKNSRETTSFFTDAELDSSISSTLKNNPLYVKARGVINKADEFDTSFFNINPKAAELMDPQQRVFLELAREVLETTGHLPEKYSGITGVFAGAGNNTYYQNNVLPNTEMVENVGDFQVMSLNEKDYIASRTAYELNLKGPAVSVYAACSTGLLTIAQAAESIRNGQCSIAVAGAAAITAPLKSGSLYQAGAMFSKDGHCRPFDANAQGTVFSDGAGVILLKSLEDAERDGDTIFAVLKGAGINNDGSGKSSFTAPSAEGQANAIAQALENAQVDAAEISYIETHGTATPIGDPIEIEGLKLAFGQQNFNQFCAVGSVKGNFGHTTAAAGVAGFIKTALALHYQQIPASINYDQPNPNIDFKTSPFFVNTALTDWNVEKTRYAGVSSFGVGGTNVHVVLQEYIQPEIIETETKPAHLISWSAKTEESLQLYTKNLIAYLEKNPEVEPANVAYTLHHTQQDFNFRNTLIVSDRQDLQEKLEISAVKRFHKNLQNNRLKTALLFPGQGSQFINMNLELYQQEAIFRDAVDKCAILLFPILGEDIRNIIYPAAQDSASSEKLNHTLYAQPAVFTMQYAMVRLWTSWGLQPNAITGHSLGEFMAAHFAGVFSLEDALKLIVARCRLMQLLPGGNMLAVKISPEELNLILPKNLSIAAINSKNVIVVSGEIEAVAAFATILNEQGIACRLLENKHAFHSAMMDPILQPFEEIVKTITLNPPKTPFVSTVTGKFIRDKEATSAAYWSAHIRNTVLFTDAVDTLLDHQHNFLIDVGPGNTLSQLVRQQCVSKKATIMSAAAPTGEKESVYAGMLKVLGQLWEEGFKPDWKAFYKGQIRKKIQLPPYAYAYKKCWVNPPSASIKTLSIVSEISKETPLQEIEIAQVKIMKTNNLSEQIKTILYDASGIELQDMQPESTFIEMGFDSLLLTQISISISKKFNVPVSFRNLNEQFDTIESLSVYLESKLPKEAIAEKVISSEQISPVYSANYSAQNSSVLNLLAQQIQLISQQINLLQDDKKTPVKEASVFAEKKPAELKLSADEAAEIKKPFGATARIQREKDELNPIQQEFLKSLIRNYNQKTAKSKAQTQQNRAFMADPRVVSGFSPATKEIVYPLVVNHSKGSHLQDIDGNDYIDALNGFGSSFLGYQPEFIKKALQQQIEIGYEIGPQHQLAGEVSQLICEFTGADRAGLCNTGSEAVLGAMRIARTVTGRSLIVAFSGSYHGIVDEVIVRGTKALKSFPAAPGIMPEAVQNMLILDYGTDESLKIIRERAHELAAVLVEPVQSRRPEFQPVEFLKEVRKITEQAGTTLIFDEVITGFRMHPGGAQALFGIQADLGTYGKVIGGGLSIGVIAGKKQFMDALDGGFWQYGDDSVPEAGVTYFAGTFVRHPLALAAAKATLTYLKTQGPELQQRINAETSRLAEAINKTCTQHNLPVYAVSFGSLWKLKFKQEYKHNELLFSLMRLKGIHIWDNFPCFLTAAHTVSEINRIASVFEESALELANAGFLGFSAAQSQLKKTTVKEVPPVPGARLGKDKDGNPAWFIVDPEHQHKFLQVKQNDLV